jgi:hypothetical protein
MPLVESELRELHRTALRRLRQALACERRNDTPSSLCLFAESLACVEKMLEYGLADYFTEWKTFVAVLDLAHGAQSGLTRTQSRIMRTHPGSRHLAEILKTCAATRVSLEVILRFSAEDVSEDHITSARRHLREVDLRIAEVRSRLS